MTLMDSFWTWSSFSWPRWTVTKLWDPDYIQVMTLSITLWYSRDRWRCPMAFSVNRPFLHLNFADSTCLLFARILSKWMPMYRRLLVHSVTSLKETAGIAFPTALLLRVCLAWIDFGFLTLGMIVTLFQASCSWTVVTAVWVSFTFFFFFFFFIDKPVLCKYKHPQVQPLCRHCRGLGTGTWFFATIFMDNLLFLALVPVQQRAVLGEMIRFCCLFRWNAQQTEWNIGFWFIFRVTMDLCKSVVFIQMAILRGKSCKVGHYM